MSGTSYYDTDAVRSCVAYVPVTSINMRWSEEEAAEFDRWLATHDAEVRAAALREAAQDMRSAWEGSWNLRDPQEPETAYSVDRWLEVRAASIEEVRP